MHSLYYYNIPVVANTTITIQQNVKVKLCIPCNYIS